MSDLPQLPDTPHWTARHGKPIIFGPHMCSQQSMVATFLEHEAALQRPARRLSETVLELLESASLRDTLGGRARAVLDSLSR